MRLPARVIAIFVLAAVAAAQARACPLAGGGTSGLGAEVSGGAVHMADGALLAPPGAVIPTRLDPHKARTDAAEAAGRGLLAGRDLRFSSAVTDRYGRVTGPAILDGPRPMDLALALVAAGAAYADPARRPACADRLLDAERQARAEKRGLWAVPGAILGTADMAGARARVGLFTLAEGRVYSARRAGDAFYVNFSGPRTGTLVAFASAKPGNGLDPAILTGTLVRVRGVVNDSASPRLAFEAPGLEMARQGQRRESAW